MTGRFIVTHLPIQLDQAILLIGGQEHGGLVTFTGMVRRHSRGKEVVRLEYEAYVEMAERKLAQIGAAACAANLDVQIVIFHRIGVLQVGELAVVIAASAPHRAPAFEACRFAIEELKRSVPIWKREITTDGEEWVAIGP